MAVRLAGAGHGQIRATHAKTMEFASAAAVTARATCVVAVNASADPAGDSLLAGPVRITLTAGTETFILHATGNSAWQPGGAAVIRRSGLRLPGTFATSADAAAGDLPAPLVAVLRTPGARIEAVAEPERRPDGRADIVLLWSDPAAAAGPQLTAEITAADLVLAEDGPAARLAGQAGGKAGSAADAAAVIERRGRVLVIGTTDLPGATVTGWLADCSVTAVDVLGLPPSLAAAAASPSRAPLVLAATPRQVPSLLRSTPAAHRLCVPVATDRLNWLLERARLSRGGGAVIARQYAAPVRVPGPGPMPVADGQPLAGPASELLWCCLDGAAADDPGPALDPALGAAVAGLIADGVSTRTAARALSRLTGWPRQRAYEHLLNRAGSRS